MKEILFLGLSLLASVSAYAQTPVFSQDAVPYEYGMHLDVAKVVKITPAADVCGPTPVEMTYLDSEGTTRVLHYNAFGTGCSS